MKNVWPVLGVRRTVSLERLVKKANVLQSAIRKIAVSETIVPMVKPKGEYFHK